MVDDISGGALLSSVQQSVLHLHPSHEKLNTCVVCRQFKDLVDLKLSKSFTEQKSAARAVLNEGK